MKHVIRLSLVLILFLSVQISRCQIAGSFTVPGSFPTIAAAINTLNILGVAGPVTIHVNAGYTEIAPNGGFKLFNPIGSSATNYVIFKKNGVGANPLITAYTGTATPSSQIIDGVWWFIGADNITIDAIDILDPNISNPATMEFGYGFYREDFNNGCNNNTIKNCHITMNKFNSSSSSSSVDVACGSRGIDLAALTFTANQITLPATSIGGTNSDNKIYSNIIENTHTGIAVMANQGITFNDSRNDIGGLSSITGNTVINFGGGGGSQTFGIRTIGQYSLNVSNNFLENNNGSGANPLSNIIGIHTSSAQTSITNINGNTFSLSCNTTTVQVRGVFNESGVNGSTVNINSNTLAGYNSPASASSSFIFIYSDINIGRLFVNSNLIKNVNLQQSGSFINSLDASTVTVSSNTIINSVGTGVTLYLITADANYFNASNNYIDNIALSTNSSNLKVIYCFSSDNSIQSNTITNISARYLTGIEGSGVGTNSIINNHIKNITNFPGTQGIDFRGIVVQSTSSVNVTANTIFSVTSNGTSTASSVGNLSGMSFTTAGNPCLISRNKIYSLISNRAGTIEAVSIHNCDANIENNIIGDLQISKSSQSVAICAIAIYSSSIVRMNYNSIHLNNSVNTGTNSGSSVVMVLNSSSSFSLNNNIFINISVPTGTGITTVVRRESTATIYGTNSNRNLFYAGVPSASRLLFYDGTNICQTLFSYKMAVSPRESQSYTEYPPFITFDGSLPNTLNINPVVATQVEGGGAPVTGITTDYATTARNLTTPDIGAWEGGYLQADVAPPTILSSGFTSPPCNTTNRTMTVAITDASGVASGSLAPRLYYKVNFNLYTSAQGVLTSGTSTNGVWTFNMSYSSVLGDVIYHFLVIQDISYVNNLNVTPSVGSFVMDVNNVVLPPTSPLSYTIETNPTISVNSGTLCLGQSFTLNPVGAFTYSYSSASSIVSPTANASYSVVGYSPGGCPSTNTAIASLTVFSSPTVAVSGGTICALQQFSFMPSGAVSYTFSSGQVVTPNLTTTYSVSGSNTFGCIHTATVQVVVMPLPSVNIVASSTILCPGQSATLTVSGAISYSWSPGGSTFSQIVVSPVSNTTYSALGTNTTTGCQKNSTITIVASLCTFVNGISTEASFTIYPNPSSGLFSINLNQVENVEILILNSLGQTVHKQEINSFDKIDLKQLPIGVYNCLVIKDHGKFSAKKIIIE